MDRKPSITITLSSDGEADDDDAAVIVDEELKANAELWMKQQEKVIEDNLVEEQEGLVEVVKVAKEDIAANLEAEVNVMEAEDESKTGEEKQTDMSEAINADNDDEREDKEDEDARQTNSDEGGKITLALVGKLAVSSNKDATSEGVGEKEIVEMNEEVEEEDAVKEKSTEDADAGEVDKVAEDDLLQGEEAHQVVHPGFV